MSYIISLTDEQYEFLKEYVEEAYAAESRTQFDGVPDSLSELLDVIREADHHTEEYFSVELICIDGRHVFRIIDNDIDNLEALLNSPSNINCPTCGKVGYSDATDIRKKTL